MRLVGVIELDDKSHNTLESGIKDLFLDDALRNAGIPILRVKAAQFYTPKDIAAKLEASFKIAQPRLIIT